jgi:plasmid stabilization system protein ParE
MNVVYSPRAIRDIAQIGAYYREVATPATAAAIADRIGHVIDRVAQHPHSAPRVAQRPDIRAVLVLRYPYKVFYRVRGDAVEVLHIRHTARRPWRGDR